MPRKYVKWDAVTVEGRPAAIYADKGGDSYDVIYDNGEIERVHVSMFEEPEGEQIGESYE